MAQKEEFELLFCCFVHMLNTKMDIENLCDRSDMTGKQNLLAYSWQNPGQYVFPWSPFGGIIGLALLNFIGHLSTLMGQTVF